MGHKVVQNKLFMVVFYNTKHLSKCFKVWMACIFHPGVSPGKSLSSYESIRILCTFNVLMHGNKVSFSVERTVWIAGSCQVNLYLNPGLNVN